MTMPECESGIEIAVRWPEDKRQRALELIGRIKDKYIQSRNEGLFRDMDIYDDVFRDEIPSEDGLI